MESGGETPLTMKAKTSSSIDEQPTIKNETFEKLGAMGTTSNLFIFLMHFFNLKHITAIEVMSVFGGTANFAPLFGAFLSDSYFGRYKTIGFASICSLLGMAMLTLTATIDKLHPPSCQMGGVVTCVGLSPMQLTFLFASFGFLIIGAGGIQPCNLAFGADQFNPNTESGKRGISIPTCLMLVSIITFFMGSRIYVKVKPEGSPLTSVAQVLVAAIRNRRLKLTEDDAHLRLFNYLPPDSIISVLPYTDHLRFLNKAAISTSEDQINIDAILYHVVINQQASVGVLQALQADRHVINGGYERMGTELFLTTIALLVSATIEEYRKHLAPKNTNGPTISSMSAFWLVPQLAIT
ncbi:hypothetical protein ACFE04_005220 [Oxalis oulophora]